MANAQSGGIDLPSLLQSIAGGVAQSKDTQQKLRDITSDTNADYLALQEDALSGTDSKGDTQLTMKTRGLALLEAQNNMDAFSEALGNNGEGAAKISTQLATHYHDSLQKALELSDSIKQRESVGMLDNPLAFMWNQIVLPDEKNALGATLDSAKIAKEGLATVNSALQETAKSEAAYAKTLSTASVQSQVDAVAAEINAKAVRIEIDAHQANAQNLERISNATNQQITMIHAGITAQQSAQQLALSQAAGARDATRFDEAMKVTKDNEAAQAEAVAYINAGRRNAVLPPLDSAKTLRQLKMVGGLGGLSGEMQAWFKNGLTIDSNTAGEPIYGRTLSESVNFANSTGAVPPTQIGSLYTRARDAVMAPLAGKPIEAKDRATIDAAISATAQNMLKEDAKVIKHTDELNPLLIPTVATIATAKEVQNSALYQKVIQSNKIETRNIDVIFQAGVAAVRAGIITPNELSDGMDTYIKVGQTYNATQGQFVRYGLQLPTDSNKQLTYNAQVTLPTAVNRPDSVTSKFGLGLYTTDKTVINYADKTARDNLVAKILSVRDDAPHAPSSVFNALSFPGL